MKTVKKLKRNLKDRYVLGISCYFHDAAACLLKNGELIAAAAEERFTRKKHDNSFPINAIEFCLDYAGVAANELTGIAFYEKPIVKFDRVLHQHLEHFPWSYRSAIDTFSGWFDQKLQLKEVVKEQLKYHGPVYYTEHHLAHAASAYYLSQFDDAVTITLDGVGEWATTTIGTAKSGVIKLDQEIQFPHSLGLLYSALTTFLGFSANDAEYKVMGLAAYGDPKPYRNHFKHLIKSFRDGSYALNMKYFQFDWSSECMFTEELPLLFMQPPRLPESDMQSCYENIAASLQERLELVVFNMARAAHQKYGIDNLCLAGGVALNSVMNGKLLSRTPFKRVFIPPDPSDAGGATGAALYVDHQLSSKLPRQTSFTPFLGPQYSWPSIEKAITDQGLKYTLFPNQKALLKTVSKQLQDQKIIGWFQGKMEWGPRALGHRSILASAATVEMRDVINEKVKHRELFRPFAPVILEEYTNRYFKADHNLSESARYMLMVYPFKPIGHHDVPAVVHVDGTGRLQTLIRKDNPLYYDLINEYYKLTGVPIIINTSFNVRGEPIVCTPQDAINCFLKTDIDYLVMDYVIISK